MGSAAEGCGPARILVQSDHHLDRSYWEFPRALPGHGVAVLAGDLSAPMLDSIAVIRESWDAGIGLSGDVVFVPGNHEFYGSGHAEALAAGREAARACGVRFLDCDETIVGGVRYLGATLWTDYALDGDPAAAMALADRTLGDHSRIGHRGGRFRPAHALDLHRRAVAWLSEALSRAHPGPTVVVTHHAPSRRSIADGHGGDPANPAFASDLEWLMLDRGPDLWVHGHTHGSRDYRVGRTRVLCNPKGYGPGPSYGIENASGFRDDLVVELPQPGSSGAL